jgi:hypothetical protein
VTDTRHDNRLHIRTWRALLGALRRRSLLRLRLADGSGNGHRYGRRTQYKTIHF